MKITTRLTLFIILITTVCLLFFGGYQYSSTQNKLYEELVTEINTELSFATYAINLPLYNYDGPTINNILMAMMKNDHIAAVRVYTAEKGKSTPVYGYYRSENGSLQQGFLPFDEDGHITRSIDLTYYELNLGKISLQASVAPLKKKLQQTLVAELLRVIILNTLLVFFILTLVKVKFLKPIISLTDKARNIAEGDLHQEISIDSSDEIGNLGKSLSVMRDSILGKIQNLEEKNAELLRSQKNLSITLNSIGDAVIATDEKGLVIRMNPVAEQLTGWYFEDAAGRPLPEIFKIVDTDTKEVCNNLVNTVLQSGEIAEHSGATLLISKNNDEILISEKAAPIRDEDDKTIGVVLVFRDITKEYALEKQLRHSQKLEAVGQLAGGVAHDFNNMLGGIIGAAELLNIYLIDNPKAKKFQHMILDAAHRAEDLTKNLLTFSRVNPRSSSVVNIHEILEETCSLLKNTIDRRINLIADFSAEDCLISGDPSHLQSVFLNLGINGAQAMEEGGILYITTQNLEIDDTYCKLSSFEIEPGLYLEVEVRDTGYGIAPENLNKIFDPFFTTKPQGKGTGLGLSVVYGTIQQHRGAITAYSHLNAGTTINILLPLTEETGITKQTPPEYQKGTGKILVVDDEELMRYNAQSILEDLGYEVLLAEDGEKALTIYKEQKDSINLIILDMMMPVMNGRDCFNALKEFDKDVDVILSSGYTPEEYLKEMREMGLRGFIRKPYRIVDLSRVVFEIINTK